MYYEKTDGLIEKEKVKVFAGNAYKSTEYTETEEHEYRFTHDEVSKVLCQFAKAPKGKVEVYYAPDSQYMLRMRVVVEK